MRHEAACVAVRTLETLVREQEFIDDGYSGATLIVRQVFSWVGRDRCTIGEVRRRLEAAREQTRTGKTVWDRATIGGMLNNPAYKGEAAFGKTALEPLRPRLRAQRGRSLQPKRAYSHHDVPDEQWMRIPVPALVDWSTRREIIRALVKRVEIDQEHVHVVFRVNPPTPSEKNTQSLQHCGGRVLTSHCEHGP